MSKPTITFIGAGHMGSALIGGLIGAGYPAASIWATCPTQAHLDDLRARYGIHVSEDNLAAARAADVLVLAVKPPQVAEVVSELCSVILARRLLVISVAAGVSDASIRAQLEPQAAIIRAMPNTPALVGHGVTVLYASVNANAAQRTLAETIFAAVGATLWLDDESHMNTVTALSGCGPAYFFLLVKALEEAALELGLPYQLAHDLTAETALGAAHMVLSSHKTPTELCQQVGPKGSGTERALQVLESGRFKELIYQALQAAERHFAG